ncbi:MAG: hypothetical protein ACJAZN_000602 [Planctomycetota bacterium]|jgi:hypothetical protein
MFIALAAASVAASVPIQEPAALHPASSMLVVQIPDVQAAMRAYSTTAVARMLADEELHTSIGQVMGGPPLDPVAWGMEQYYAQVASGELPPMLDYLDGLKSASFSIEVAGADAVGFVMGLDVAEDKDFFASQNLGFRMVVDFVDEPSAEMMTEFLLEAIGSDGPPGMKLSAKAMTMPEGAMGFGSSAIRVWSFVPEEAGNDAGRDSFNASLRMVGGGTRLALFAGNVEVGDYVRTLGANAMDESAVSVFEPGRAAFTKKAETPVLELFMRPFLEDVLNEEQPEMVPALDLAEALIGPAASMAIRGGHWRMGIDGGQFVTQGIHDPSEGGPLSGVLGAQPLDPSALALVHPDALITSVMSLDASVLAKLFVQYMSEDDLAGMDAELGFRPDRDIAGALGNAVSYSLPPLKSLLSAPNLMGAIRLNDKDKFTKGMDGLLSIVEQFGEDIQLVRDEYKGAMMYTLSFTGDLNLPIEGLPIDPASFFKPTITIMEDRVLMTTLSTHAKREVRRVLKLAKKGLEPPVHEKIMAMGDLGGATTVGYADWPTFFGALYSQVKGLAPLIAGGAELPIDPAMLPDAAVLTRHFKPSENWTRVKDGKVMQYAKSSLGAEVSFLPSAMLALVFGTRTSGPQELMTVEASIEQPPEEWHEAAGAVPEAGTAEVLTALTKAALMEVDVALTLYQLDHKGAAPDSLAILLVASEMYPKGYLEGGNVPVDAWEHAFVYTKGTDGYTLHSMGPDGQDNSGGGDDIGTN